MRLQGGDQYDQYRVDQEAGPTKDQINYSTNHGYDHEHEAIIISGDHVDGIWRLSDDLPTTWKIAEYSYLWPY